MFKGLAQFGTATGRFHSTTRPSGYKRRRWLRHIADKRHKCPPQVPLGGGHFCGAKSPSSNLLRRRNIRYANCFGALIKVSANINLLAFKLLGFVLIVQLVGQAARIKNVLVTLLDDGTSESLGLCRRRLGVGIRGRLALARLLLSTRLILLLGKAQGAQGQGKNESS